MTFRRTSKHEPVQWLGPLALKVAMILSPTRSSPKGFFAQTLVAQSLWPQRATRARRSPSSRAHRPSIVTAMLTVEEPKRAPAAKTANLEFQFVRCFIEASSRAAPERPRDLRQTGPASAWRLGAVVARSAKQRETIA